MERVASQAPGPHGSRPVETTGLTVLREPGAAILDIVLVHGFNGHPERTWTYKGDDTDSLRTNTDPAEDASDRPPKFRKLNFSNHRQPKQPSRFEVCWPRDLLPHTVPNARIMTFGYDAKVHHVLKALHSQNTIYDHALELLNCLSDSRRHSCQGGASLIQVFCEQPRKLQLFATYKSTIGVFFLGTPHGGSDPRGFLANVAERAARAAGFTVNQNICETLLPSSERLRELRDEFPVMIEEQNWTIVSFRETVGMKMFDGRKVVDENSACLGNRNLEVVRDIEGDHRAICRFRSLEDSHKNFKSIEVAPDRDSVTDQSVEIAPRTEKLLSSEQREELLGLLYFDQIDARFMSLRKAQAKTCKWLLRTPQCRNWINARPSPQVNPSGFFWIKGNPGAGKSVMMKFLFSEAKRTIRSTNTILISFFFNARGSELEKSTLGLYRSLLLQLFEAVPEMKPVVDHLGPLGFQAVKRSGWYREILKETLALALDRLQDCHLCCYIDALDECPEDNVRDTVSFFEDLRSRESSSQFRICLSSRHYPEIGIRNALQMVLEKEQDYTEDIRLYIDSQLKIGDLSKADENKAEILDKPSGIFLWVNLVIPMLNKEHDRGRIKAMKRRLNEIPAGLHDLFIDILTRDCKNMNELYLCIQLVLFAKVPLRPEELRAAAMMLAEEEGDELDPATSDDLRRFILDASKGLAEITTSKKPTVQFIHESVRDFLLKEGGMNDLPMLGHNFEGQGHRSLTTICMLQVESWYRKRETPESNTKNEKDRIDAPSAERPFNAVGFPKVNFLVTSPLDQWKALHRQFERRRVRYYYHDAGLLYVLAENGAESLINIHPLRSQHLQMRGGQYNLLKYASSEEVVDLLFKFSSDLGLFDESQASEAMHHIPGMCRDEDQEFSSLQFVQQTIKRIPHLLTEKVWVGETALQYGFRKSFWGLKWPAKI
ncbi:hypothetical protein QQZ08_012284 [Neonectria magnoliae]|uniref:Nephrocystin 3-like N-terminal domain-containing protein n=1 Tax=Neonectria magnoliae TaxID=2732573 RepID=A0ABR1H3E0_9HYPO